MERFLSQIESLLKSLRGEVAEGRMTPLPIVVEFDEFENGAASLGSGLEADMMDQLGFERAEETLHGGIVETIAFTTHAGLDFVFGQKGLIFGAGILAATV